ncbi:DsbA family protein [Bdellovibrio sp. NC01]|uniref:DsbA family protein n=1 Tax=Bdellovibrio sp. NC01 TaxID=2220073 RepID=UPI00115A0AFE|nr:DsbA family protein [Bdellovibrio sp. NC01]QDK38112.1 DsbA family protein [Bdellovibrio sp. NC01]
MGARNLSRAVTDSDHIQGNKNAAITLVEYGDYQCPFCGAAYPMIKTLQNHFGDKLRFVFRNFPLVHSHRYAVTAALAAEAAGLQGKFWEMHDMLYENQSALEPEDLIAYANALKLDVRKFQRDISNEGLLAHVKEDYQSGEKSGVDGTPAFYINGVKYTGPYKFSELKRYIEGVLGPGISEEKPY